MTIQLPENVNFLSSGKIRDIYSYGEDFLLFRTSDRISAFDVVLPDIIPGKGKILNDLSEFWMRKFEDIVPNHLTNEPVPESLANLEGPGEFIVVKKLKPLPVEAIVRGYIIGSGWKDYQKTGEVCGILLPPGLNLAEKLDEPIFTPSTKAKIGIHDENITFSDMIDLVGPYFAGQIYEISLKIYEEAEKYARKRGIIIADTKFEFGLDENDKICIMDEVLTPDSSRFWDVNTYKVGISPPSFDKQIVRDYLETLNWDKTPPGPHLPLDIINKTSSKYAEIRARLMV